MPQFLNPEKKKQSARWWSSSCDVALTFTVFQEMCSHYYQHVCVCVCLWLPCFLISWQVFIWAPGNRILMGFRGCLLLTSHSEQHPASCKWAFKRFLIFLLWKSLHCQQPLSDLLFFFPLLLVVGQSGTSASAVPVILVSYRRSASTAIINGREWSRAEWWALGARRPHPGQLRGCLMPPTRR